VVWDGGSSFFGAALVVGVFFLYNQTMLGPAVNALVIVVCALSGAFLAKGIPRRFEEIVTKAIGLATIYIGLKGAFDNQHPLLLIMSLAIGAVVGEAAGLDALMRRLGDAAERRLGGRSGGAASKASPARSFSKGFVQASILFCSGAMAIVGSMQSGFYGNHDTLFAKSALDGVISVVFGATLGIGVAFSAIPVFLYQGGIALAAMFAGDLASEEMIREMSAVGSLLVAAIGFNFLDVKEIRVANLIPAVFVPLVYFPVAGWLFR
jgi:uncharacterized membrane protein YqgA involved in biofilm formation